jgi:hypothetical protein
MPKKGLASVPRHPQLQGFVYHLAGVIQSLEGATFRNGKVRAEALSEQIQHLQELQVNLGEAVPLALRQELSSRLDYAVHLSRIFFAP